jgi:hypothetical protein
MKHKLERSFVPQKFTLEAYKADMERDSQKSNYYGSID